LVVFHDAESLIESGIATPPAETDEMAMHQFRVMIGRNPNIEQAYLFDVNNNLLCAHPELSIMSRAQFIQYIREFDPETQAATQFAEGAYGVDVRGCTWGREEDGTWLMLSVPDPSMSVLGGEGPAVETAVTASAGALTSTSISRKILNLSRIGRRRRRGRGAGN
jgi:hypothetical protein